MANEISNAQDLIDSRDVIARIEELRGEAREWDARDAGGKGAMLRLWAAENPSEADELAALEKLAEEGEGLPDWEHGVTLVRDSYFRDYAEELAEDIGAIDHDLSWPHSCIDWERAARELRMDYTGVEFDGITYWAR